MHSRSDCAANVPKAQLGLPSGRLPLLPDRFGYCIPCSPWRRSSEPSLVPKDEALSGPRSVWSMNRRKAYLLGADGPLPAGSQILNGLGIVPQIQLASDQDNRQTIAEVQDFGDPLQDGKPEAMSSMFLPPCAAKTYLFLYVFQRIGGVDTVANQDDVRVGV